MKIHRLHLHSWKADSEGSSTRSVPGETVGVDVVHMAICWCVSDFFKMQTCSYSQSEVIEKYWKTIRYSGNNIGQNGSPKVTKNSFCNLKSLPRFSLQADHSWYWRPVLISGCAYGVLQFYCDDFAPARLINLVSTVTTADLLPQMGLR